MKAPSRSDIDNRSPHTIQELRHIIRVLETFPSVDNIGGDSVIEVTYNDEYSLGWAFIDDGETWAWTPFDGTCGDESSL